MNPTCTSPHRDKPGTAPTIIVLAAGVGSRLGTLTEHRPKCLTPVAGLPILRRIIDAVTCIFGERCNMLIVVGHLKEKIEAHLAGSPPAFPVQLIVNGCFAQSGTIESLRLALASTNPASDIFVVEGDVVFEPSLLKRLTTDKANAQIATVVASWSPELSGTFVILDDSGTLQDWVHETQRSSSFPLITSHKTVNLTRLSAQAAQHLRDVIDTTVDKSGVNVPLEYAFRTMLNEGRRIDAIVTRSERWFEIDTVKDLAIADRLFE